MSEKMKMEQNQEQSLSILTNKTLEADIKENQCGNEFSQTPAPADEEITGKNCPVCGYPTVREYGLEVCYHCGWSEDDEPEGYYEE